MSSTHIDPSIPSDQDALLVRKASRTIAPAAAPDQALSQHIGVAGREFTALELPPIIARLLVWMLAEIGNQELGA